MEHHESLKETKKHARSSIDMMDEQNVPAYPRNYAIWYAYFTNAYPDLSEYLNRILEKGKKFTEDVNILIYDRFFSYDILGRRVREATVGARTAMEKVLEKIKNMGSQNANFNSTIEECCARLDKASDKEEVRELTDKIITVSRKLQSDNQAMEGFLNIVWKEMGDINKTLAEAQRETLTDALTGMANRKLCDSRLRQSLEEVNDTDRILSVLLIDVDNLADFNDEHGEQIGDKVLIQIAKVLGENVKGRDLISRYSDDEFVVILPHTGIDSALKLAKSVRVKVAESGIVGVDGRQTGATISIGVAQMIVGEPLNDFIQRAKDAMLSAKEMGKDQVVAANKPKSGGVN